MTASVASSVLQAFAHVAPHLSDPQGRWHAWLTEPAGVYDISMPGVHMSDDFHTFMAGPVTARADEVFGTTRRLLFLHDWRHVSTYSITLRSKLVKWGLSHYGRTRVENITALLADDAPALVRMACHAGVTLMAVGDVPMSVRTPRQLQAEPTWETTVLPLVDGGALRPEASR
jgi:hypothetical protein